MNKEEIKEMILESMREFVGDTSVPYQLDAALKDKASIMEQIDLQTQLNTLEQEVQRLRDLVGDTSVSEQINAAING